MAEQEAEDAAPQAVTQIHKTFVVQVTPSCTNPVYGNTRTHPDLICQPP